MATTLVHDITTVQPAPSSSSPMAALSSFLSTRQRQLHSAHHTPLNDAIPHVSHSLDTSTLAAADYDVDIRTGFMPPTPPVARLPAEFEVWESTLEEACGRLKLGQDTPSDEELELSEKWRSRTRQMPLLYPTSIEKDELLLRRAHAVLAYLAQFYVHTQVPQFKVPVAIPAPIAVPLIEVSKQLDIAAILTYSDTTIYNWGPIDPNVPCSTENLRALCNFSGTVDEEHFYLTSSRIELRGVEALEIMRASMNEAFVADTLAKKRLGIYLEQLARVIDDMTTILLRVRESCDPATFYNQIRPWFRGGNSTDVGWTYEGVPESVSDWAGKLGGPSAGQSTLIHALDAFLGIDHSNPADKNSKRSDPTFVMRQRDYMPRHHRAFLVNLSATTQSVRAVVEQSLLPASSPSLNKPDADTNKKLQVSYDAAVLSLKKFRDAHIRIATLYIVNQARKGSGRNVEEGLTGTGGTKLVPFLKEIRDNTAKTMVDPKLQRLGH